MRLPEVEPAQKCRALDAVRLATHNMGTWKGISVLAGECEGWIVFEDLSGFLQTCGVEELLALSEDDELVLAAYNDSVPFGRLVVIADGTVRRDFSHQPEDPEECWNRGSLPDETEAPIETWIDVAGRVDDVELDFTIDEGLLLIFGPGTSRVS